MNGLQARGLRLGYAPVLAAAMAIMFVRTLLAVHLLDVPEFGLFGVGMLVSNSFCMLGSFGFYLLLQRDLPMLIAKGLGVRGKLLLHQTLILTMAGFIGLLPLAFIGLFSVSPGFFAISLLNGLAQQAFLVVTLQSRSEGRSMHFAVDNLLRAVVVVAGISLAGWIFDTAFSMLLAESIVTLAITARVYAAIGSPAIGGTAGWIGGARALTRVKWWTPMTLMATGIVGFAMLNGDRWIAASLLRREDFALYAFAGIIMMVSQSLQSVINVSVFPGLARVYALDGSRQAARRAIRYSLAALLGAGLLVAPGWSIANYAIERFFPAYMATREFLGLFLLIASLRVSDFLSSFMIIAGRERLLLGINLGSVGAVVAVWLGYFGLDVANIRSLFIAGLATSIAVLNFTGCLLATIHYLKAER